MTVTSPFWRSGVYVQQPSHASKNHSRAMTFMAKVIRLYENTISSSNTGPCLGHIYLEFWVGHILARWWFLKYNYVIFTPNPGGNDPIGLAHIFQMGWFNHQLGEVYLCWKFSNLEPPKMIQHIPGWVQRIFLCTWVETTNHRGLTVISLGFKRVVIKKSPQKTLEETSPICRVHIYR